MVFVRLGHTKLPEMRVSFLAGCEFRAVKASALAVAVMAAACLVFGTARAQETERPFGLFDRIFGGSDRVNGGGPGERAAPPAGQERTAQASGSELVVRLDRLETQIRQLTGVIEQLQFRNQQLEGQVRRMQEDAEYRFQELGSKGSPRAARPQNPPMPSSPAATVAPGRRGDAFDPAQNPSAPGSPHTLGAINPAGGQPPVSPPMSSPMPPPMVANAGEQPVGAPGGRGAGAPLDLATMAPPGGPTPGPSRNPNAGGAAVATLPPSQTPRDEFDLAYGYVLRRDYVLAEEGFRNFLAKYPNDRLAGDATYWWGESLFQRQQFRDAAEAFLNVSTKYESTAKAPDALLRLGQSLAQLGEKEAACASLGEVVRKFPRASAGVKQGVEREQKRVRC
jgi:tol-pal system protein YbgF